MSICINAQMWSDVEALFEHPSKWYESYQENGTKYFKRRRKLEEQLQQQLNACAGEIFLCGIPADTRAEKIAQVASLVGEVYILRFKVHFSGASRGFAYLQYIDPNLMTLALKKLPLLFRQLQLPTIKVCESRNTSKLLLCKTDMSPLMVFETLKKIINFNKLVGHEIYPGCFEYQIVFKCNEEAVHARRELLKSILKFGHKTVIVWDNSNRSNDAATINNYPNQAKLINKTRFYKKLEYPNNFEQQQQLQIIRKNIGPTNFDQQSITGLNNFASMKLY
ncbi:uncharacterized protein LOC111683336 [Lucilia cuprina]|nr:uncharacterized protein LOC111683336 [Lucilia cuprina]